MLNDSTSETTQETSGQSGWKRRWLQRLFVLTLLVISGGLGFERYSRNSFQSNPPASTVIVDGRKVHFAATGTGTPTIVFEAGLGQAGTVSSFRSLVVPKVEGKHRVFCYDRAGLGWSEKSTAVERTSENIAEELFRVLEACGEQGPFILVAHSFGGHSMRVFADQHPDLVAGVVLLDVSHPEQVERMPDESEEMPSVLTQLLYFAAGETGILRLMAKEGDVNSQLLPGNLSTIGAEFKAIPASDKQALGTDGFGDRPLIVLTGAEPADDDVPAQHAQRLTETWIELQRELAGLSKNSKHVIDRSCGHFVSASVPQKVADCILEVAEAIETGNPL